MIALVVPAAPGLLPARGSSDPFAELRDRVLELLLPELAPASSVAVVVPPLTALDRRRGLTAPPRRAVAEHLLAQAGWRGALSEVGAADLLLVLADGSARRTTSSPGPFDERAVPFDDAIADALATGDSAALAALDVDLATELWCQGAEPLRQLGSAMQRPAQSELREYAAPFGVGYFFARWDSRDSSRES